MADMLSDTTMRGVPIAPMLRQAATDHEDAERWRHVRTRPELFHPVIGASSNYMSWKSPESLDAYIDKARQESRHG